MGCGSSNAVEIGTRPPVTNTPDKLEESKQVTERHSKSSVRNNDVENPAAFQYGSSRSLKSTNMKIETIINTEPRFKSKLPEKPEIHMFGYEDKRIPAVRPSVPPNQLYTDRKFPLSVALPKTKKTEKLKWQRPGEFVDDPKLFGSETNRFSVGQGSVGDCWFLSVLSAVADKPELLKQMIPEDAYKIGTEEYDGIFHCRFWVYGKWVDVYIDDYLPMTEHGGHFGARGAPGKDVMWVPLLEKAFARLKGSYPKIENGDSTYAFSTFTGGFSSKRYTPLECTEEFILEKVNRALTASYVCPTGVHKDNDNVFGLVGDHAYVVTGCARVPTDEGEESHACLVRIRNPWGSGGIRKGVWDGPFGASSKEWDTITNEVQDKLQLAEKETGSSGEFWIPVDQFRAYFEYFYISRVTPALNEEEDPLHLDNCFIIFSQWNKKTSGGSGKNYLNNPKFLLTVNANDGEPIPVCFQLIQKSPSNGVSTKNVSFPSMRLDVHKIYERNGDSMVTFNLNDCSYMTAAEHHYNLSLEPGQYLLIPHVMEKDVGKSQAFLLRAYSTVPLTIEHFLEPLTMYIVEEKPGFQYHEGISVFSKWHEKTNGGLGKNYLHNPKFVLTVNAPDSGPVVPVCFQLIQKRSNHPGSNNSFLSMRVDVHKIYERNGNSMVTFNLTDCSYMTAAEHQYTLSLEPGQYLLIPHVMEKDVGKSQAFLLRAYSTVPLTTEHILEPPMMYTFQEKLEYQYPKSSLLRGAWSMNIGNSGGPIGSTAYGSNPQISFAVSKANTPVCITLLQPKPTSGVSVGFQVQSHEKKHILPLSTQSLYGIDDLAVKDINGKPYQYMNYHEAISRYVLPAGQYFALLFNSEPGVSLGFVLRVSSADKLELIPFNI